MAFRAIFYFVLLFIFMDAIWLHYKNVPSALPPLRFTREEIVWQEVDYLRERLRRYAGLLTCVLFLGGEWQPENLLALLRVARDEFGLKTCLYTGLERDEVPPMLLPELSFLKTGRWLPERGGLDSPTTNQRFVDLQTGMDLTSLFWRQK